MKALPRPTDPTAILNGTYDAWNRVTQAGSVSYQYDGRSHRIEKFDGSETTRYYYSQSWQVLEERIGSATTAATVKRQYVWGQRYIDEFILSDYSPTSGVSLTERYYALQDALFSVVALTDEAGSVLERYAYSPYGQLVALNANGTYKGTEPGFGNSYTFTGRRFDKESGLYYYRARYYDAKLGRFISKDPIGFVDGYNLYRAYFVPNNLDPSGESILGDIYQGIASVLPISPVGSVTGVGIIPLPLPIPGFYFRVEAGWRIGACCCQGEMKEYAKLYVTFELGYSVPPPAPRFHLISPITETLEICPNEQKGWSGSLGFRVTLGAFVGSCSKELPHGDWSCSTAFNWTWEDWGSAPGASVAAFGQATYRSSSTTCSM